ncbi:hypothetical protein HPB49_008412 [Dermacentor silvarum]|uniref:Uncharacterized protein n=1 Tax=Dermacentor silvarum TaxID=543639 RepID=A0ACB8DMX5_DERSI|nr:hypothetical protein HPB49_008412 [Dermacentor silvarum]
MSSLTWKHHNESVMSDITDVNYNDYKMRQRIYGTDLTLTLNSDGSPVFNSSNYSIWPVQLALNELPPRLCWNNIMTQVLWYGKEHPDMTRALQAFVRQLQELNKTGLTRTFANTIVKSKVFCICCADSPARAAMQHRVQFNGLLWMPLVLPPRGTVKYCVTTPFSDRTDEEALKTPATLEPLYMGLRGHHH